MVSSGSVGRDTGGTNTAAQVPAYSQSRETSGVTVPLSSEELSQRQSEHQKTKIGNT
jgi:hypothetical protein